MKRWLGTCLIALFLLGPAAAGAAPGQVSLDEHIALLNQAAVHLEQVKNAAPSLTADQEMQAARALVQGQWQVVTPRGPVEVDLRPLQDLLNRANPDTVEGRSLVAQAPDLVREYVAAAESLRTATVQPLPADARQRLELALAEARSSQRWYERLGKWLGNLYQRMWGQPGLDSDVRVNPRYLLWGALAVGLAGLAVLIRGLIRSLTGNAPGEEAALKGGRREASRPLTPAEQRDQARRLARDGEYHEALRTVHLSLLRRYDETGLIRYHPAQTNREYERQLRRRHPVIVRTLRTLHNLVEDRLYSGHGATQGDFTAADGLVEQLWREGDAASRSAGATTGPSSSALLR